ncbi:MAG TPA: MMPL family transporter [Solirubrobacterales bacterium]|nr:MMPL family transporter [Solirubrobacterales bacterium]
MLGASSSSAGSRFGRVAGWAARHARPLVAFSAVLAVAAAVAATQLPTDAGVDTLADAGSPTVEATERVRRDFGEEPVVVLVKGELPELLLGDDLFRILRLEGCLAGKVPEGAEPLPGPCAELAEMGAVEFLTGPGTFLNESVVQIDNQLRRLAENVSADRFREYLLAVATKYGITSVPSITNEEFVATVVFDFARPRGTPKARLAYLFPNAKSAQIVIRLRPDLSEGERHRAIGLIEAAVADTTPRKACKDGGRPAPCFELENGSYVVSGAPVVIDGVSRALKDALLVLFAVAVAVMALVLFLVFRSRWRLLPLLIALMAAAITFGLLALVGGSLTMASIAALPILIGLGVDYAIQFQARFDETGSAEIAAARGGPTIAAACAATAVGFLALQLSPVPMVRGFGWVLVVGIVIAFAVALTVGLGTLARWRAGPGFGAGLSSSQAAGESPTPRHPPVERVLALARREPLAVLAIGVALAVCGWIAGTRVETVSDIRELAPQSIGAVEGLSELQETTGVSGSLDVLIEADDLTDPEVVEWMAGFKQRVLESSGFGGENPSCLRADVCPGPALSDFLVRGGEEPTAERIDATLSALSPYALRQVAPLDPETGEVGHQALISFGIRAQSLEDQQKLVDRVRDEVGEPPAGVEVQLAGLSVIAAESASDLSASRYWLTLAGIVLVGLALLLIYRSWRRALVPLVPTVLASGWASLLLWMTGIPLNPMSAALGALTIAIATEFGVLLVGRFHEERGGGVGVEEALDLAYSRTGAAVVASGATAIAGFAVLVASDVQMLRDFGLVTVVDLAAALAGVLLVLPATLLLLERR